jgi:hypothetical protein
MSATMRSATLGVVTAFGVLLTFGGAVNVHAAPPDLRLVEAVQKQDKKTAQLLIEQHVDVNARQADGSTALAWAVHWDDVETAV